MKTTFIPIFNFLTLGHRIEFPRQKLQINLLVNDSAMDERGICKICTQQFMKNLYPLSGEARLLGFELNCFAAAGCLTDCSFQISSIQIIGLNFDIIMHRMIALLVAVSLHTIIFASAIDSDLLSWEPHIALIENFLSAKECDDIISHAKSSNQYKPEQVNVDASVYFDHYPRLPAWLQAIERRIGAVTGQAPHPGEEPINIHQIRQHKDRIAEAVEAQDCIVNKPNSDAKTCRLSVGGTHHDKVCTNGSFGNNSIKRNP